MAKIQIAAISRAGAYSPNHIGNDAAILNATIEHLQRRGCEVTLYNEEQFLNTDIKEDIILDMCRQQASIAKLQQLEEEGKLVINSGFGIENCTRERMTRLLLGNGVPYPESLIVDTNANARKQLEEHGFDRCWLKRGDFHAMHKEDVSFCRHPEEVQDILHEFFFRGIKRAVINKHLEGDLVKFYGLSDGSFFYWFYPLEGHHSKYGAEAINGMPSHFEFSVDRLKEICLKAAEVTGIVIYGGDCIVDSKGDMQIIDFNDWPSFAPCRQEAAPCIARTVYNCVKDYLKCRQTPDGRPARAPRQKREKGETANG